MKRKITIAALLTAAAASALLTGCGADMTTSEPLRDIVQSVIDNGKDFPEMVEVSEDNFAYEYGLDKDDYDEYAVFWAGSGADADEICVVKTSDTKKVRDAVGDRLSSRKDTFEDYSQKEYDKLCDSKVKKKGDYVYWICTKNNSENEKEFLSHFDS